MADSKIVIENGKVLREGGLIRSAVDPCECCGDVCINCHPLNNGSDPNNAVVAGAVACAAKMNGLYTTKTYFQNGNYCRWFWDFTGGPEAGWAVALYHAKQAFTLPALFGCPAVLLSQAEWLVELSRFDLAYLNRTKTSGFSCDPITGRVSGSQIMPVACVDTITCGGDTPTITVAA